MGWLKMFRNIRFFSHLEVEHDLIFLVGSGLCNNIKNQDNVSRKAIAPFFPIPRFAVFAVQELFILEIAQPHFAQPLPKTVGNGPTHFVSGDSISDL